VLARNEVRGREILGLIPRRDQAHSSVIVTPPTAADTSAPTLAPASCRTTPVWLFCSVTPPAPAATAPPAPRPAHIPLRSVGLVMFRACPCRFVVDTPMVKPTLMPATRN